MSKRGYRPSNSDSILGFCSQCTCNYGDGYRDCKRITCPFYSKHRYRTLEPDTAGWLFKPWSNHEKNRLAMGLTKEQYIQHILSTKSRIPITWMRRAKCFACNLQFQGGMPKSDCGIPSCAIYYWMPFRTNLPTYDWMFQLRFPSRHRTRANSEGILKSVISVTGIETKVVDQDRYLKTYLTWTGEPLIKKRMRVIQCP